MGRDIQKIVQGLEELANNNRKLDEGEMVEVDHEAVQTVLAGAIAELNRIDALERDAAKLNGGILGEMRRLAAVIDEINRMDNDAIADTDIAEQDKDAIAAALRLLQQASNKLGSAIVGRLATGYDVDGERLIVAPVHPVFTQGSPKPAEASGTLATVKAGKSTTIATTDAA